MPCTRILCPAPAPCALPPLPPSPSPSPSPSPQAGSYVRDDLVAGIVRLISSTAELQGCAAQRLYSAVVKDDGEQPLVQVGDREGDRWVIGRWQGG